MRGVLEAVDARARTRAGTRRGAGAHPRLLVAAALLSLALGLALRQALAGRSSTNPPAARAHVVSPRGIAALAPALRGPVSAALGADSPSYLVTPAAGGSLAARTPAQHLASSFGRAGVTVRSDGASLSLGLRGIGSGSALSAVAPAAPRGHANRIGSFTHPGLTSGTPTARSASSGFRDRRPPAAGGGGPLTLELSLSSSAPPVLGPGAKSFTVGQPGPHALTYTGLTATDARGRVLPSRLRISGGRLDDRGGRQWRHHVPREDRSLRSAGPRSPARARAGTPASARAWRCRATAPRPSSGAGRTPAKWAPPGSSPAAVKPGPSRGRS